MLVQGGLPSPSEAKTRFIESKEGEKKAPEKRRCAFVQVWYNEAEGNVDISWT